MDNNKSYLTSLKLINFNINKNQRANSYKIKLHAPVCVAQIITVVGIIVIRGEAIPKPVPPPVLDNTGEKKVGNSNNKF